MVLDGRQAVGSLKTTIPAPSAHKAAWRIDGDRIGPADPLEQVSMTFRNRVGPPHAASM